MKKFLLLFVTATFGFAAAAEPPAQAKAIIEAAKKAGLLTADDFSSKLLSSDELASLKKEIPKHDWIAEIPGLAPMLIANYPAEIGIHKSSGFALSIYHSGGKIMLLSCSVPLVNGGQKEQKEMIETMLAATEVLVGSDDGVRKWLDAEWQHSWEISAKLFDKQPVDQKEIIRKKEFGPFLVTVWGVVPDIVFLNCVRKAESGSLRWTPKVGQEA
jgi:hypothetical protein